MRFTRLLALSGLATGFGVLLLPSLATDAGLVEELTGLPVPSIWATLTRAVQWSMVGIGLVAAGLVLFGSRSRFPAAGLLGAVGAAAWLVWQARVDVAGSARLLAGELDAAAGAGIVDVSPGAGAGAGFHLALAAFGVAAVAAVWAVIATRSAPGPDGGPGMIDGNEAVGASGGSDLREGVSVDQPRYLDLVIEGKDPSPGE